MEQILLISMGFGTGHNQAAKVLQTTYQQKKGIYADYIDLLTLIPKAFHPLLRNGYQGMLNHFPLFYQYLYGWTHQYRFARFFSSEFIEKMGWTIRKKINHRLDTCKPTKIITTHPFALLLLPPRWSDIPSLGVVTDYELHPIWLARMPDILCLPKGLFNDYQLGRLEWQSGTKIVETGLPIQSSFYDDVDKETACKQLGLSSKKPVVLIMGGGTGIGPLEDLVKQLDQLSHIQFVVITGNNTKLYYRLKEKYDGTHIQVHSFRQDIPMWMSAADLLVTKPGGVTISEAIAKQLPMLLFEAFPGQEEANQKYLVQHGVAIPTSPHTISKQILTFFKAGMNLNKINQKFELLQSPQAADQIIQESLGRSKVKLGIF